MVALVWTGLMVALPAVENTVGATPGTPVAGSAEAPKVETVADHRKAAEKIFADLYGKDELAAQRSREPEDNFALAQKLAQDAMSSKLDPVLAEVLREHASNLLTMLRTVSACDQAIALRADEMNLPGADREEIQTRIVEINATALKYMATQADQMAGEKRVLQAQVDLAEIQVHKRAFSEALKTLDKIRVALARNDPSAAAQVAQRIRLLQPLTQRESRLAKLKKDWQAKPGDKTVAGDLVRALLVDWGDVMGTGPYLAAASGDEFLNVAPLLAFEETGGDYTKATLDQVRELASGYEAWAADRQTAKLAQLMLYRRAVEAGTELARLSQGMDSIRAKQAASQLQEKLDLLEKEQAELMAALAGGISIDGGISLSSISSFDLADIKPWDPQTKVVPRTDVNQLIQLTNGTLVGLTVLQGPNMPTTIQQGYRALVCNDPAAGWVHCPTVLAPPSSRVLTFADLDGKSFWVWRNNNGAISLVRWAYDPARKDVAKQPNELTGTLPKAYSDERGHVLGADGSLMITTGPVYQEGPRWMVNPHILKYDMKKFGDPVMDLTIGQKTDSWRQRPIMTLVNNVWHVYYQDGGKMDEMRWGKIENGKIVEIYRFKSNGNIQQLLPGKGAAFHFLWEGNGRWWMATWDGRQMTEEKYIVNWQNGMQRTWVNAYAYGDQVAVVVIRSFGDPKDASSKLQVSTMFRSQGNWSAEKPVAGTDTWYKTYGFWDPPAFRSTLTGLNIPIFLGDHDLKAIANFKVTP